MSSLLELIARRRRATASRRLGPPPAVRASSLASGTRSNGTRVNGAPAATNGHGHSNTWLPVVEDFDPPSEAADDRLTVEMAVISETEATDTAPAATTDAAPPAPPAAAPRYESWLPSPEWLAPLQPAPAKPAPAKPAPTAPAPTPEPPAPAEPEPDSAPSAQPAPVAPGLLARGRMRRRARYLRRLREIQLRDIGGFSLELHRHDRERPDLVRAKLESAAATDRELRTLERALDGSVALRELREPGIGGVCFACGAVHASDDRFCASCGESLAPTAER